MKLYNKCETIQRVLQCHLLNDVQYIIIYVHFFFAKNLGKVIVALTNIISLS